MTSPAGPARPVRHVAQARRGALLDIRAVVVSAGTEQIGSAASYRVTLLDDAAELDLLFLGRGYVAGFTVGRWCAVTGRAALRDKRLVVWNPRYQLLVAPTDSGTSAAQERGETDRVSNQSRVADDLATVAQEAAGDTVVHSTAVEDIAPDLLLDPDTSAAPRADEDADEDAVAPAGRFRIYLGPAAGVGKTYAMLDEGQRRRNRGKDVVVAVVNTHGRPATAAKLAGLEVIPPKTVHYRGAEFEEMDLDAVLARHPDVALVDELAHTNVPGSGRNEKRWQDVLDLLNANISVISTVNVQHIESLADVAERVSGVAIRERVPDAVVRRADQIELVDSSPEQLRRRMLHGNIYPPERARQALHGFFRAETLAALRELALRFLADEVDDELIERFAAGAGSAEVGERVLVAVTPAAGADTLLRRAARLAARLNADLYAVHVRSADTDRPEISGVAALHTLADNLGAAWQQLDGDPVTAIMDYAREHRITQIVLGRSQRNRWQRLTGGGSTVRRLTRRAMGSGIDIHIVARDHLPALLASPAATSSPSVHGPDATPPTVSDDGQ